MGQIANKLLALNSAKHAIREAINEKGGGPLERWDPLSAYPGAIANIPSGGGDVSWDAFNLEYHRVIFMDWDGTVLKDVMVKHGDPVEAPEAPTKWNTDNGGLVFDGWTHTNAEMESVLYDMCIGAMYGFSDASLLAVIDCPDNANHYAPTLQATGSTGASIRVYWGDGSHVDLSTGNAGAHTYTDGEKEHVIVVKTLLNSGGVQESSSYFYYSVFSKNNWTTKSGRLSGFGWPVGLGSGRYITFNGSEKDRYNNIRGCVIPRGSNYSGMNCYVRKKGTYLLAFHSAFTGSVKLANLYASLGTNGIECSIYIPILERSLTFDYNVYGTIERGSFSVSSTIRTSGGSFTMYWYTLLSVCRDNIVYGTSAYISAIAGTLANVTTASLRFNIWLKGLEKVLATLPSVESQKTITIFRVSDEQLDSALVAELNEKGYTITYSQTS